MKVGERKTWVDTISCPKHLHQYCRHCLSTTLTYPVSD